MDKRNVLPTTEMREGMPSAFKNSDDYASEMNLRRENIAEMAFRAVYADKLGAPTLTDKPVC